MPEFRWKGKLAGGGSIEGRILAPSKEAALTQLRGQGIAVGSIKSGASDDEPLERDLEPPAPVTLPPPGSLSGELAHARATTKPRPFRGLAVAAVLVVAAVALGLISPLATERCDRDQAGVVTCTFAERSFGVVPVWERTLTGVTRGEVETRETVAPSRNGGTLTRKDYRLVLYDARGNSIRPRRFDAGGWRDGSFGDSGDAMLQAVPDFLADPEARQVRVRRGYWIGLLIPAIPLMLGLLMVALSALALSRGATSSVYDGAGALAADVDRKRRR